MTRVDGTTARHWLLLRGLERAPRKVSQGFVVSRRSIQRDLVALSTIFPLVCDDRSKPYGWSWSRDAEPFDLPAMDPRTAMTFRLVGTYLGHLLPRVTWDELVPHLERADRILDAIAGENPLARWPDKVRVVPDAVSEQPPAIAPDVLDAAYLALLDERVLEVSYRSRSSEQLRALVVHPVGLVFRGPLAYLVCIDEERELPITLLLSRAERATVLDRARSVPPSFDLDGFLAAGEPGYLLSARPMRVVARIRRDAAQRVLEAPPGHDPEVEDEGSHVRLRTTLPDSRPTRAWLLGFGSALEVLEPAHLRKAVAAECRAAANGYEPKPSRRTG